MSRAGRGKVAEAVRRDGRGGRAGGRGRGLPRGCIDETREPANTAGETSGSLRTGDPRVCLGLAMRGDGVSEGQRALETPSKRAVS